MRLKNKETFVKHMSQNFGIVNCKFCIVRIVRRIVRFGQFQCKRKWKQNICEIAWVCCKILRNENWFLQHTQNLRDLLAVPQRDSAYHLWGVRKFFSRKCGKLTKLMVFENNFFFRDTPEQKNNFFEISQNFWCQIWNFVFYWKIFKNQFRP